MPKKVVIFYDWCERVTFFTVIFYCPLFLSLSFSSSLLVHLREKGRKREQKKKMEKKKREGGRKRVNLLLSIRSKWGLFLRVDTNKGNVAYNVSKDKEERETREKKHIYRERERERKEEKLGEKERVPWGKVRMKGSNTQMTGRERESEE